MFSESIRRMPFSKASVYFGRARNDLVDFSLGEPKDMPPEAAVNAYARASIEGNNRYAPVQGLPELRIKIAEKLNEENKIPASSEEVLVTNGASEAISLSIMSLVDKGDDVILAEPSYPIASHMARFCGAKPVSLMLNEENNFYPNLEELKEKINEKTRLLVINTPHNPTGVVFDKKYLRALFEIYRGTILVDEVYENFTYGKKHISLASFADNPERIITINSFSKTYSMCGYRIGYLHAQKSIISQMLKLKLCISTCTGTPSQKAALLALEDNAFPKIMKKRFEERRKKMVFGLKRTGLQFIEPDGAFYIFPNISHLGSDEETFDLFAKAGVLTMPGRVFHENCINNLRFSFVAGVDEIEKGIERLIDISEKKII